MARGKAAEKGAILQRQLQALELRKAGYSYRAIGERLGISHVQAYTDVNAELARLTELRKDSTEELRELELERLDVLLKGLEPMARVGNPGAVNSYLRVMERRAKLLGLDAPTKQEVTGADGGAIEQHTTLDLSKLTDEQLRALAQSLKD
jgi:hypothetical protein